MTLSVGQFIFLLKFQTGKAELCKIKRSQTRWVIFRVGAELLNLSFLSSWHGKQHTNFIAHVQVRLLWHSHFKSVVYTWLLLLFFFCVCVHDRMCEWCWCVGDSYVSWLATWLSMAWVVMTIFSRTSPWWPWLDTHTHTHLVFILCYWIFK